MAHIATPDDDERERRDVTEFLAALRKIRAESGWGEVVFVVTDGDISHHSYRVSHHRKVSQRRGGETMGV